MAKLNISRIFTILLFACTGTATAAAPVPAPPTVSGSSYLLMDQASGRILVEQNADEQVEPASITKIMTSYVAFHALRNGSINIDDEVLVSEKAWRMEGSRMFIEVGKRVSVRDLLKGVIIQSGNDASVALAEYIAGSEDSFADLMNQYAALLGMANSHFVNSTGLPHAEHYITARDIALLTRAMIREFPEEYRWFAEKQFTYNGIQQDNRNTLLFRDPNIDGVKTGHTEAAGFCLVASGTRNDMRLISVVMGTRSERVRADASQSLMNYGFRFFETHRLYVAGDELINVRVWKGAQENIALGPREDLFITIPRGQYGNLDAFMDLTPRLVAPLMSNTQVGVARVTLGDELVAEQALYPLEDVAEGSFFQRLKDRFLLMFQ
ncbi:MAG: D-alanyl-D-alanine carboxypeptidase [Gammaproteobacteria bacterium]|nr:D-alanyl-D-alanine carboxypeptidase [Gammaproteobacteria bacterium]